MGKWENLQQGASCLDLLQSRLISAGGGADALGSRCVQRPSYSPAKGTLRCEVLIISSRPPLA